MIVDLFEGFDPSGPIAGGVITMRDGTKFYSMCVGKKEGYNGLATVRLDKGEYGTFTKDGQLCYKTGPGWHPYGKDCDLDIIQFIRCAWYDEQSKGLADGYNTARKITQKIIS